MLTSELETVIAKLPPNDVTGLSRAAAEGFARRPRLGLLLAILSTAIEQNVSEQTVIELKRTDGGDAAAHRSGHSRKPCRAPASRTAHG